VVRDFSKDMSTSAIRADANNGDTGSETDGDRLAVKLVLYVFALGSLRRNDVVKETLILNGVNYIFQILSVVQWIS
jgi:hypothetical protein